MKQKKLILFTVIITYFLFFANSCKKNESQDNGPKTVKDILISNKWQEIVIGELDTNGNYITYFNVEEYESFILFQKDGQAKSWDNISDFVLKEFWEINENDSLIKRFSDENDTERYKVKYKILKINEQEMVLWRMPPSEYQGGGKYEYKAQPIFP